MRGRIPNDPTVSKVAFTVEPLGPVRNHFYPAPPPQDSGRGPRGHGGATPLAPERLTAPAILEVRKVALWVQQKLADGNLKVSAPPVTFSPAENRTAAQEQREPHIAILHDGKLLPSELSLNTVKRFLCRGKFDDDRAAGHRGRGAEAHRPRGLASPAPEAARSRPRRVLPHAARV